MKTIVPKLDLAIDARNYMAETPVWSVREQALYWINCEDPPAIYRWVPGTREIRTWQMPKRVGGFVFKESEGVLVALADGLYDFDFASGALTQRVASPLPAHAALHETQCDRQGRFWVGGFDLRANQISENMPQDGKLFRLDGSRLVPVLESITCSNGLAFAPDGRTLYHTDTPTGVVNAWMIDPATGGLSGGHELVHLDPHTHVVDGATVDAEGGYWATLLFSGALRRYLPDGTLDFEVALPFSNPTKVAFGGPELDTLYITTTKMEMGRPNRGGNLLGGIFAFKPGIKGLPDPFLRESEGASR